MKGALFVPTVPDTEWVGDVLPGLGAAELPVAGRRFIDYALEAATRFNIMVGEVLDWHWTERLQREFDNLNRSPIPVIYQKGEGPMPRGLRDLEGRSSPLTADMDDGLVVLWGLSLPCHRFGEGVMEPIGDDEAAETPIGAYRYSGGRWMRISPKGLEVRDARGLFEANTVMLRNPYGFTLPGYSSEEGVHIGSNVVLERGTVARPPVIVGDDAWCERNVVVRGDVVVGRGAVVGEGAKLDHTVVCDRTFVGRGLDLTSKLVFGNRVIDGLTGAWTDVEDAGVAHRLRPTSFGWLGGLWRFLAGTSMRGRV